MASSSFDPDFYKPLHEYGGYDANEKGVFQYPRDTKGQTGNLSDCSFQNPFPPREQTAVETVKREPVFDSVTRQFRKFVEDPNLPGGKTKIWNAEDVTSCCHKKRHSHTEPQTWIKKPIDPIHWDPTLFDSQYEKYYLTNVINENPYREFLSSYAEDTKSPRFISEYKYRFSGNPTMETSRLGVIPGVSRPTDLTASCVWNKNLTRKLRDAVFTREKPPPDFHLDPNDPKRYNPWGRHLAGHRALLERNWRPALGSGVEYSVCTVLPAVEPESRGWVR